MIVITKHIINELTSYLSSYQYDRIFAVTDTNTRNKCLPVLEALLKEKDTTFITIEAEDANKSIRQVETIWNALSNGGASRHSLLINIGGGMVTDLGGFAGATFKRGLHNLNIPTTLMASVDAAIGGKTGINFNGLKNEIGSFYEPDCVIIDCTFLQTLDRNNFLSGYAEMLKHGLVSNPQTLSELLSFDIEQEHTHIEKLNELVRKSVAVKEQIVAKDPKENGIRKALNFGHTIGHALESLSFLRNTPLLHGHAVAAGMVCELYLSYKTCGMPVETMREVTRFIKEYYPAFLFSCNDYEMLYELMTHDKKNEHGRIYFALLGNIGDIRINQEISKELILESLDFYCENMH